MEVNKKTGKRKKITTVALLALIVCLIVCSMVFFHLDRRLPGGTAIFYSPHPDDEVLSMGSGLLEALDRNEQVIMVLLSQGKASKAIDQVNERLLQEGYPPINAEEFGAARAKEFRESALQLGVKEENIYLYDLPDGSLNTEEIKEIMTSFAARYPEAVHHTMTYKDPHRDHAAAGKALQELKKAGIIRHTVYYIPVQEWENLKSLFNHVTKTPPSKLAGHQKALAAYKSWDPAGGRYAIGITSVPGYFEIIEGAYQSVWSKR